MFSSTSQAVLIPLLELLKVDVLLSMKEEKESMEILHKIHKKGDYFPVIFLRTLKDLQNKDHKAEDKFRAFLRIDWTVKDIYKSFKKYNTNFITLYDWYKKLDLLDSKVFELKDKKVSFRELNKLVKSKKKKRWMMIFFFLLRQKWGFWLL